MTRSKGQRTTGPTARGASGAFRRLSPAERQRRSTVRWLAKELAEIDALQIHSLSHPPDPAAASRAAALSALQAIEDFLIRNDVHSAALYSLRFGLQELERGHQPLELRAKSSSGRKPDHFQVQGMKGRLAGLAYVYMKSGVARGPAAAEVARKIPNQIAQKISARPSNERTVKSWMDSFGGTRRTRDRLREVECYEEYLDLMKAEGCDHGTFLCLLILWVGLDLATVDPMSFMIIVGFAAATRPVETFSEIMPPEVLESYGFLSRHYNSNATRRGRVLRAR
jgi:hypothetical protein